MFTAFSAFPEALTIDNESLVISQHCQPVLNVGCGISEAVGGFKPCHIHQSRGTDFGNQFFFGIGFTAEEGCAVQSVQPLSVSSGVGQLMEGCAVIFGSQGTRFAGTVYLAPSPTDRF